MEKLNTYLQYGEAIASLRNYEYIDDSNVDDMLTKAELKIVCDRLANHLEKIQESYALSEDELSLLDTDESTEYSLAQLSPVCEFTQYPACQVILGGIIKGLNLALKSKLPQTELLTIARESAALYYGLYDIAERECVDDEGLSQTLESTKGTMYLVREIRMEK